MSVLKICVCGDTNTGKSTYINRLMGSDASTTRTMGVLAYPIRFKIKYNNFIEKIVDITFWDVAGDDNVAGLRDCYFIQSDGVLIFDAKDATYSRLDLWNQIPDQVLHPSKKKNRVIVLSKFELDQQNYNVGKKRLEIHEKRGIPIVPISSHQNMNLLSPLQILLRIIYKKDDLEIIGRA